MLFRDKTTELIVNEWTTQFLFIKLYSQQPHYNKSYETFYISKIHKGKNYEYLYSDVIQTNNNAQQTQTTEYEQVYCQKYLIYTDTDLDECRAMAARVKTMHDIIHTNKQQQHTNKQTTKS